MEITSPPCMFSATLLSRHPTGSPTTLMPPHPQKTLTISPIIMIRKRTMVIPSPAPTIIQSPHHTMMPVGSAKSETTSPMEENFIYTSSVPCPETLLQDAADQSTKNLFVNAVQISAPLN